MFFAGAGGGWSAVTTLPSAGRSLLEGAVGGRGCLKALQTLAWDTHGGFGGGGGACTAGGGGGGFSGEERIQNPKPFFVLSIFPIS